MADGNTKITLAQRVDAATKPSQDPTLPHVFYQARRLSPLLTTDANRPVRPYYLRIQMF